jgi:xylan 1,4-beta-xylosidase
MIACLTSWRRAALAASVAFLFIGLCRAQVDGTLRNPIVPGDHPDPTIIRVGKTYWTASTSGNWAPEFPLYRSDDLRHWTAAGAIFPHSPQWARGDFWAPELVFDGGRVLVYYVARKRDGPLCVAVATAAKPQGPYEDHGPIMCQEDGSIDPSFVRDEQGKPYLVWKEDGNSRNQPTPIWAQPLTDDLLKVTGEETQLIVNDPQSWEGGVVEAPYILRHKGFFYLFYAGNACCGVDCHYAEGVARAEKLLGPWTKDPANPIIRANGVWRCPGHGTTVETPKGKDYFVFHAYPASGTVYLGRQSVIDSITWSGGGWPVINAGRGPGVGAAGSQVSFDVEDDFKGTMLDPEWKWPVGHEPRMQVARGRLTLFAPVEGKQAFVARSLLTPSYTASVGVAAGDGGLGLIGDAQDDVALSRTADGIELLRADREGKHLLWQQELKTDKTVWFKVMSTEAGGAQLSFRVEGGAWTAAGENVVLKELLPWDSGLRIGLVVEGPASASFVKFSIVAHEDGDNKRSL